MAYWQRFGYAARLEHETRNLMRDVRRLTPETVEARARAFFKRLGIDPDRVNYFDEDVTILPPLTRILLTHLMPGEVQLPLESLTTLKNERYPGGALPDLSTLDGFVIAAFESVARDAGPATWELPGRPPAKRRYEQVYLTDHELAVISCLLNPGGVRIHRSDLSAGTPPGQILDRHRHNISNKRRVHGYLPSAIPWVPPEGTPPAPPGGRLPLEVVQKMKEHVRARLEEEAERRRAGPPPEIPWPLSVPSPPKRSS